jgi:hypothetical protein
MGRLTGKWLIFPASLLSNRAIAARVARQYKLQTFLTVKDEATDE